jgi:hypothetical protein
MIPIIGMKPAAITATNINGREVVLTAIKVRAANR